MLLAAPSRVIDFDGRVVANDGKKGLSEETAVIGKLREFIPIAKAFGDVRHRECQRHHFAYAQRLIQGINAVEVARRAADQVKGPVKLHLSDALMLIGHVDFRDWMIALVLQGKTARAAERSLRRKNVDRRIDRGDLGLIQALEFLELLFIVSQLMPTARRRNVLVEHVGVVVVPSAGTDSQQCARRHGRG